MEIAILGAGKIGGTLGKHWAKAGHTIHFGVRDPQKPEVQALIKSIDGNVTATGIPEAIAAGEVILFAIPGPAMEEEIMANSRALNGKILIDATNNMRASANNNFADFSIQTPKASVYRAFNSYGWENFEKPDFGGVVPDLFYCGSQDEAQAVVEKLITDIGLNPVYLGGPEQADLLDGVLKLWFTLSSGQGMGRHLAFKVLKG